MARNNRNRNKIQENITINNSILDELKDISSDETLVETLEKKEEESLNEVEEITEIVDKDTAITEQEETYEPPVVDVVEKSDEVTENNEVIAGEDKTEEADEPQEKQMDKREKVVVEETPKEVKKTRLTMKEVFGYEWMGMNYDF